jgi:putative ABC transport system permease protein
MVKKFFILTIKALRFRPIRSWLTVIGVVIGVMLVVTILSLGSGIKGMVAKMLQMFGSDYVIVMPGKETNPFTSMVGGEKFRESDLFNLGKISGVDYVVPMDIASLNIDFLGEKKTTMVHGAPWDGIKNLFESSQGVKLWKGTWPTGEDSGGIVVGFLVATKMFKNQIEAGDDVIVKGKRMKVSGVIAKIGVRDDDNSVYVSLKDLHMLTGSRQGAVTAMVKILPGADINLISKQIRAELSNQKVVREFAILTPEKISRLTGNILSIIELVFMAIGLISLLVGAVGIMNSTYTSVLERTKQIGIMKAIGASNEAILSLFLIESGMIGLIGGFFGLVLGVALAFVIGFVASYLGFSGLFSFASLDYFGLFSILVFTFVVGIVSGYLPAKRGAKLDPAEALRYE